MKPAFNEALESDLADALDARREGFDFEEVDRRIAGIRADLGGDEFERLGTALNAIFTWVIGDPKTPDRQERLVGRRFIALAWCLRPDFFSGTPSLSEIARRLGCNKVTLSVHSAQASRDFSIRNRAQSHGWNFKQNTLSTQESERSQDEHT